MPVNADRWHTHWHTSRDANRRRDLSSRPRLRPRRSGALPARRTSDDVDGTAAPARAHGPAPLLKGGQRLVGQVPRPRARLRSLSACRLSPVACRLSPAPTRGTILPDRRGESSASMCHPAQVLDRHTTEKLVVILHSDPASGQRTTRRDRSWGRRVGPWMHRFAAPIRPERSGSGRAWREADRPRCRRTSPACPAQVG